MSRVLLSEMKRVLPSSIPFSGILFEQQNFLMLTVCVCILAYTFSYISMLVHNKSVENGILRK